MRIFSSLNVDFIGKRNIFYVISIAMILTGIGGLVYRGGPVLGIDFTGGTVVQIGFKKLPPIAEIRDSLSKGGWQSFTLQSQPVNNSIIIRIKTGPEKTKSDVANGLVGTLKTGFSGNVNDFADRVEFVGPTVGRKLIQNTFWAIFGSLLGIVIYVAFRFKKIIWGIAGVIALGHDVFITFALMNILNIELSIEIVAALLTLAGYSINDTIVIFDRIRENIQLSRKETPLEIFNRSINETMARTINTSLTVLLASLCLTIWGGETIFGFSLALTFGLVIGSYSTIGVASALVYQLEYQKEK
jgi:preprotein translocase subunit SecF